MKKIIKGMAVLLACSILFAGCGDKEEAKDKKNKKDNNEVTEEIVGNDWRVTGSYAWGTLEHDEKIDVLVGMAADKLTVFYDKESKEAYTSVAFPYETTDLEKTFNSLLLEDYSGDGYTDIFLTIYDQQGDEYSVTYIWNAEAKEFVYDGPGIGSEIEDTFYDYIGAWKLGDDSMVIVIDFDKKWACIYDGEITVTGTVEETTEAVTLYTSEGVYYCTLAYSDNAVIDEYDNVFYYAGPAGEYIEEIIVE